MVVCNDIMICMMKLVKVFVEVSLRKFKAHVDTYIQLVS